MSSWSQRGGCADLPVHVAGLGSVDEQNLRGRTRGDRAADLEDEHRVGVPLRVESDVARREQQRRGGVIHPRCEALPAEVGAGQFGGRPTGSVVVAGDERVLGAQRDSVVDVGRSQCVRSARDRGARVQAQVPEVVVGPVLVTVEPARTEKLAADPRSTGGLAAWALPASSRLSDATETSPAPTFFIFGRECAVERRRFRRWASPRECWFKVIAALAWIASSIPNQTSPSVARLTQSSPVALRTRLTTGVPLLERCLLLVCAR